MNLFALIFAVLMLSLFWGGFIFMLFYSLKLKNHEPMCVEPGSGST